MGEEHETPGKCAGRLGLGRTPRSGVCRFRLCRIWCWSKQTPWQPLQRELVTAALVCSLELQVVVPVGQFLPCGTLLLAQREICARRGSGSRM